MKTENKLLHGGLSLLTAGAALIATPLFAWDAPAGGDRTADPSRPRNCTPPGPAEDQ